MKKMNRNVKAIVKRIGAAALLSAMMGTTAFGGTWQTTAGGWQYLADNGQPVAGSWIVDNGQDYRIHENGIMATGWYQDMADGGRWYYLDPQSGAMRTGWIFDNGSWYFLDTRIGGPRGGMLTGWQWIDGKCYYLDPARGGAMAAGYLSRLGHRRVLYLGPRRDSVTHALRHQGFLTIARERGMEVETVFNPGTVSSAANGYRLARQVFARPFPQTAVFAPSDAMALGVLQAADELGLDIPGRISLLGYDDIEYASLPKIRLSTLAQPTGALAESAVRLLLELIDSGGPGEFTHKLIAPRLVERSTCRPPRQKTAV